MILNIAIVAPKYLQFPDNLYIKIESSRKSITHLAVSSARTKSGHLAQRLLSGANQTSYAVKPHLPNLRLGERRTAPRGRVRASPYSSPHSSPANCLPIPRSNPLNSPRTVQSGFAGIGVSPHHKRTHHTERTITKNKQTINNMVNYPCVTRGPRLRKALRPPSHQPPPQKAKKARRWRLSWAN